MKKLLLALPFLGALSAQTGSCNVLIGAYDPDLSKVTIEMVKEGLQDKGYSPVAVITHASELMNIQINNLDYMVDLFEDHNTLAGKRNVDLTKMNEPGHEEKVAEFSHRTLLDPNKAYVKMINKLPSCNQ